MLFLIIAVSIAMIIATSSAKAKIQVAGSSTVILRIEGAKTTIFEGSITSGPSSIATAESGVKVHCDRTFANDDPAPGNTPLDALDAASKARRFTCDGSFDGQFNDFAVDRVSTDSNTNNAVWGTLVNYQTNKFGEDINLSGCQQEVKNGDEVLYPLITAPFPSPHHSPAGVYYSRWRPPRPR